MRRNRNHSNKNHSNNNNKGNNKGNKGNNKGNKGNHKPTTFRIFKNSYIQNERIAATKYMRGGSRRRWA